MDKLMMFIIKQLCEIVLDLSQRLLFSAFFFRRTRQGVESLLGFDLLDMCIGINQTNLSLKPICVYISCGNKALRLILTRATAAWAGIYDHSLFFRKFLCLLISILPSTTSCGNFLCAWTILAVFFILRRLISNLVNHFLSIFVF